VRGITHQRNEGRGNSGFIYKDSLTVGKKGILKGIFRWEFFPEGTNHIKETKEKKKVEGYNRGPLFIVSDSTFRRELVLGDERGTLNSTGPRGLEEDAKKNHRKKRWIALEDFR